MNKLKSVGRVFLVLLVLHSGAIAQTEADLMNAVHQHPANVEALVALGAFYNQAKQFGKSEPLLRKAVQLNPKLSAARLEWAHTLARLHRFPEASEALKGVKAPEGAAERVAYDRLLAGIDAGNGDFSGAAAAMDDAVRLAPGNPQLALAAAAAQSSLGDWEERQGKSVEAASAYQQAVRLAPQIEDYRLSLAIEYLRHQAFGPAVALLEEGVTLFPQSPRMVTTLGLAYFVVDRNADAVKTLLSLPTYPPALHYLGEIELQQPADPDAEAVNRICSHADFGGVCGGLMLRQAMNAGDESKREEILGRLSAAVRANPKDATAQCELGKAYAWARQWSSARTELEACERLQPDLTEVHYRLYLVYKQLGLRDLAEKEGVLRSQAEAREGELNKQRYATLTRFLYTEQK